MYQHRWMWIPLIAAVFAGASCQREQDEVKERVKDLEQAEKESPEVAQDIREQLEAKKGEVAKLEEKLALAEQGVTDRVVRERNALQDAVKRQEQNVQREVNEAQKAAQGHNVDAERARRELEQTKTPSRVEATVKTERTVVPSQTTVEVEKQQQQVPIDTTKTVERRTDLEEKPAQQPAEPAPAPAPAH